MKRVLVTGASGWIGQHALPLLIQKGYEVHAVSHDSDAMAIAGVIWHKADLLKQKERSQMLRAVRPTHVLHFAWVATPGVYWTSPLNEEWKDATIDLITLSKEKGVQRFVGAGSCAEYDWSTGHCDEKRTQSNPATPYGKAKAEAGVAVISEKEMSTAWGRIFHLYGPHEHPKRFVSSVIISLLHNKEAQCTHGKQVRDFLHVTDVASAFVALLESDVRGAVNIASGVPVTIEAIAREIGMQLQNERLIRLGVLQPPENDPPKLTASVERLQKEAGWKPALSLQEGIRETIDWWKANR